MAYSSKYYDPVKAHEYYMKTRELKGYADRYGGSRGDGTSAASTGIDYAEARKNASGSSTSAKTAAVNAKSTIDQHNQNVKQQIQNLRDTLKNLDKETLKNTDIKIKILDQIQRLRESLKGGSTSGFNQKGQEAAMYIKDQMDKERDDIIKQSNKDADKAMLDDVKRLAADIKAMRESGRGVSHKEFAARIKAMLGKTKKEKIKSRRKHMDTYKQKYKDEIDKLRQDSSMFAYWDIQEERRRERTRKLFGI